MAESDTSWHAVKGPNLDGLTCREKLYHLLALFFASRHIADLCYDEIGCSFRQMLDEHQEQRITQLLVETAVLIRMKDDLFEQQHGVSAETQNDVVGLLRSPDTSTTPQPLTLREGANKVIHAKLMNFDLEREDEWHARYLKPVVYLYGEQRGTKWKAELNVVKWAEYGCAIML
jgi:hypothetical protein